MAGKLTTHVLDLVLGAGAGGLTMQVRRLAPQPRDFGEVSLDSGGRGVLAEGGDFLAGTYELVAHAGAYHRAKDMLGGATPFLDEVPLRFNVADASAHTHVPLLLSLYGYSVYRGG
jgi:5-hydroxyisourate hydrolase